MKRTTLLLAACLFPFAASARADFITGQVVDAGGVGVANVDIDVKNLGSGGTPNIFNDGTDANGFFTTTVPNGTYRVTFNPPPPPGSTSLALEIEPVTIIGTLSMGTIQLPAGVALSGRVLRPSLTPAAGVNIDVIDENTGTNLLIVGDTTNALGNFSIAVPPGPIEVRLDTTPVSLPLLAPRAITLSPSTATNLGDIVLAAGNLVTATVRRASGVALANVDLDVIDTLTNETLYTPGDNTNATGLVDVVVPTGSFQFEFCPPNGTRFVAQTVAAVVVTSPQALGIVTLPDGVFLSGTITGVGVGPLANVDVDVSAPGPGGDITLCSDNTSGAGFYRVVVPPGTWDVTFTPPQGSPYAPLTQVVVVSADTVSNAQLSVDPYVEFCFGDGGVSAGCTPCACGNEAPAGTQGGCLNSAGTSAVLLASGVASVSSDTLRFQATDANPVSFGVLVSGDNRLPSSTASPCFGLDSGTVSTSLDGLRCVGGGLTRHGSRPSDSNGAFGLTTNGWGPPNGPTGGLAAQGGFVAGQIRHFQLFYRENPAFQCHTGQNTTPGVSVTFLP